MKIFIGFGVAPMYRLAVLLIVLALAPLYAARGAPPVVEIKSPASPITVFKGQSVPLRGHATDTATGNMIPPRFMVWASNVDGRLGNGPSVEAQLSAGIHTVSLTATNDKGEVAVATVVVTVEKK